MKVPELLSFLNPYAPQWAPVLMHDADVEFLHRTLVMFVATALEPNQPPKVLGTGFIFQGLGDLLILTATHIFTDYVDRLRGRISDQSFISESTAKEVDEFLKDGRISTLVNFAPPLGAKFCRASYVHAYLNKDYDTTVIQVRRPADAPDVPFIPLDPEKIDTRETVLLAGFVGDTRVYAADQSNPLEAGQVSQETQMRAGYVAEIVSSDKRHMLRVNIPSVPGMIGGPLLRRRLASEGKTNFAPLGPDGILLTAAGVISRPDKGGRFVPYRCPDGETWVVPVVDALTQTVPTSAGMEMLGFALDGGRLPCYEVTRRLDPAYLAYLDEAGTADRKQEPFTVVAGVLTHSDEQRVALEKELAALVAGFVPDETERAGLVLHAGDIYQGEKKFDKNSPNWPLAKRLSLLEEICALIARHALVVVHGRTNRDLMVASLRRTGTPEADIASDARSLAHSYAFLECLLRMQDWMRYNASGKAVTLTLEDLPKMQARLNGTLSWMRQNVDSLRLNLVRGYPLDQVSGNAQFLKKTQSALLQLADTCAYVIKRKLMGKPHIDRFYRHLDGLIVSNEPLDRNREN